MNYVNNNGRKKSSALFAKGRQVMFIIAILFDTS